MHHAKFWLSFEIEPDQRAPSRHAANECPRTVDGIQCPGETRPPLLGAIFLAKYAMVGKALLDQPANDPLAAPIGVGYRIPYSSGLHLDRRVLTEIWQDGFGTFRRQVFREAGQFLPVGFGLLFQGT